jgi:hypothetical protein
MQREALNHCSLQLWRRAHLPRIVAKQHNVSLQLSLVSAQKPSSFFADGHHDNKGEYGMRDFPKAPYNFADTDTL